MARLPGHALPSLPIVDLEGRPEDRSADDRVAEALDAALAEVGFCYLRNAGVPAATVATAFAASRAFHALDAETKQGLAINAFHRGYLAPAASMLRTSSVAPVTRPNLSESFLVLCEVAADDPEFGGPLLGPNQWPSGLPGFRPAVQTYVRELNGLCRALTRLVCLALGLAPDHLDHHFEKPMTWLRLLHYPPLGRDAPADQFGAAPHTDYGFITVLAQDDIGGLQVRSPAGEWLDAAPIPGTFVLNVGDMLERWTDGRWPSTAHRVRNVSGRDRYSIAHFYDPQLATVVERLPGLPARTDRPPVLYRDYLLERLDRNYAYRQTD